jgi:hypothetical protein
LPNNEPRCYNIRQPTNLPEDIAGFEAKEEHLVIFEVLTAVTTKNTIFWDVMACSVVQILPKFRRNILPQSSEPKSKPMKKYAANTLLAECFLVAFFTLPS